MPQKIKATSLDRPVIYDYRSIPGFFLAMIRWHKMRDPSFSVRARTRQSAGCSPSLATQVIQGKRKLTRDRVETFSKLLDLTRSETAYLDRWVERSRALGKSNGLEAVIPRIRALPQNHLLSDWLNVYVKDACNLFDRMPSVHDLTRVLGGIASPARIARSLSFLMREGFLRKTLDGKLVPQDRLTTTTDDIPNAKIRQFHKHALKVAAAGIETFPIEQRRASAVVLSLNESSVPELQELLREFHEKLQSFCERHPEEKERLFQVLIHFTPIGGIHVTR